MEAMEEQLANPEVAAQMAEMQQVMANPEIMARMAELRVRLKVLGLRSGSSRDTRQCMMASELNVPAPRSGHGLTVIRSCSDCALTAFCRMIQS